MSINLQPVIGLVPARGGSKGVLRKNMRMICGRPLIEFTINAAKNSKYIDIVFLSSDCDEILKCGSTLGAQPIKRPEQLASDTASAGDVVMHFLKALPQTLIAQDPYIVYLQPTSPLRSSKHIDVAIEEMEALHAHTLVSVKFLSDSPFKSFVLDKHQRLRSIFKESMSNARRQDLPKAYIPNGAIYIFRKSDFLKTLGFPSNGSVPFVMSEKDSIDIDTEEDLVKFERLLRINGDGI